MDPLQLEETDWRLHFVLGSRPKVRLLGD